MSLKMEVVSAMIILLLMRYSYKKEQVKNIKERWFQFCLNASMASIIMNILSVWGIRMSDVVPHWLNMLISALYYLMISFTASVVVIYLMYLIMEHSLSKGCLKKAFGIICFLFATETAIMIYNCYSGWLFYFENGVYHRGPLNALGYAIVLVEIGMVIRCYLMHREIVDHTMKMVMRTIPFVTAAIIVFQLCYRDMLMNGMIAATANLIIFINFQNSRLGMDYLTHLGNRAAFVEQLDLWKKNQKRFHVVEVSLNKFGQVNRKFGQKNGDEFLYAVARYLESISRDLRVFRIGSVDFAILCTSENCSQRGVCIRKMQKRFEQPFIVGDMEYRLSASYADFEWEGEEQDSTQIIEKLEYAMQIAKEKGNNQCVQYNQEIDAMIMRQKYVIEQMHEAVREKSYDVFFQPIYCWKDDLFCSAEALVRLEDKNRNMIFPNEFIPIAESTGMIREITWIVVEKVCRFLAANRNLPLKAVSINMSIQQFLEENMAQTLLGYLEQYKISPHLIKIEITERIVAENPEKAKEILESLTERGIGFYLDDFGIGYSNFAMALSLPFDTIKVDKTLTDKLLSTGKDRMIVDSVVRILTNTDYNIVAEGAETAEVVERLKELGVDRIQGYYYARPMPLEQYLEFMNRRSN